MTPEAWDVYWAFRLAFLGRPEVRISIRDPRPQSSRFVQEEAVRVFLWDEGQRPRYGATAEAPIEVPRVASLDGAAYDSLDHWAAISLAWWQGKTVGVVEGRAEVDPHQVFARKYGYG